jgi:hypothetical protein
MQADLNPNEPLGKIGLFIFLTGTLFSDVVEFGPLTQVVLNITLIIVGVLTGVNYVFKLIENIRKIRKPKDKDDV